MNWDDVQRILRGGVRAVGRVSSRDWAYCDICCAVTVDLKAHADYHAAMVVLAQRVQALEATITARIP